MTDDDLRAKAQSIDVTVWVGKAGIESVVEELSDQLDDRELVKVKFLRSARGADSTDALAESDETNNTAAVTLTVETDGFVFG